MNPFGHIDLRVADIAAAQPFYDALLPALGFTERYRARAGKSGRRPLRPLPGTAYFAVTESAAHIPNENRIAFWVASRGDVERVASVAREAGALDLSGPKEMPYGPGYYAPSSPARAATGSRCTSARRTTTRRAPRSGARWRSRPKGLKGFGLVEKSTPFVSR